jgi:hypothetical protein
MDNAWLDNVAVEIHRNVRTDSAFEDFNVNRGREFFAYLLHEAKELVTQLNNQVPEAYHLAVLEPRADRFDVFPSQSVGSQKVIQVTFDPRTAAVIVAAKADDISSAPHIVRFAGKKDAWLVEFDERPIGGDKLLEALFRDPIRSWFHLR